MLACTHFCSSPRIEPLTQRPDERPLWPTAIAPILGTVLIAVALLSLVSRPWRDRPATATAAPSGGPRELSEGPTETSVGRDALVADDATVTASDTGGPTEIASPSESGDRDLPAPVPGPLTADPPAIEISGDAPSADILELCDRIGAKLGSVSAEECQGFRLRSTSGRSLLGKPLAAIDYLPTVAGDRPRVLLLGGIHGDEYSAVSIVFKWLAELEAATERRLHWRIIPLLNPDGLLRPRSQRMNDSGVDLNRNFPTPNWKEDATDYWVRRTGRNPRRYPGPAPLSEPESRYLHDEIARFEPDVIVAVHAPLEVVDFDGPNDPPNRLGSLYLRRMGTYPGSLGRYGGEHVGLPVVTIELPSAGTMPPKAEQRRVWNDLGDYLERTLSAQDDEPDAAQAGAQTAAANS